MWAVLFAIALIVLVVLWVIHKLNSTVDVLFVVKKGDTAMIVTEFDLNDGGKADIKLVPVTALDQEASIEEVNFASDDPDVALTVDIADPLLFHAEASKDFTGEKDVNLQLSCDGHVGEGVNQINKTLICHLKRRDAVDVKFNVTVVE